jgi:hypothetical protein
MENVPKHQPENIIIKYDENHHYPMIKHHSAMLVSPEKKTSIHVPNLALIPFLSKNSGISLNISQY